MERTKAEKQIIEAVDQLFTNHVMSHSGHGNLSARIDENTFLITTKGGMQNLSVSDLALVDLNGSIIEGRLEPTNLEIVEMHSVVYQNRGDAESVIHTHSPGIVAFALANRQLPCRYEAMLRWGQASDVPVTAWGPRGSKRSVEAIERTLRQNQSTQSLILANHGLLAFGKSPLTTAGLICALEEAAEAELAAMALGGAVDFPQGALQMVRESMARARPS